MTGYKVPVPTPPTTMTMQQQEHLLASSESDLFAERDEVFRLIEALSPSASLSAQVLPVDLVPSGSNDEEDQLQQPAPPAANGSNDDHRGTSISNNEQTEHKSPLAIASMNGGVSVLPSPSSSQSAKAADDLLASFRNILDGYQECPTLLDRHLERMATSLAAGARTAVHELFHCRQQSVVENGGDAAAAAAASADPSHHCPEAMAALLLQLRYPLSALYALSKVRGRKQVQNFLPHGTEDVEPVLYVLRLIGSFDVGVANRRQGSGDRCGGDAAAASAVESDVMTSIKKSTNGSDTSGMDGGPQWWESTYILLTWLGMLSLVPFDLTVMDSTLHVQHHSSSSGDKNKTSTPSTPTLASSILSTSKSHLSDPGPTRDAASSCLASLLSRPDLESCHLEEFANWSDDIMGRYLRQERRSRGSDETYDPMLPLLIIGTVQTLAQIYKSGTRSNLMGGRHLATVERLWTSSILVADAAAPPGRRRRRGVGNYNCGIVRGGGGSPLLRKLLTKLFARVGATYLPPRVASWRYDRGGRRSLLDNLASSSSLSAPSLPVKEVSHMSSEAASAAQNETTQLEDDLFYVPDQVEDAMAQLLLSLTDPSTVVRWSAAKGVGRITERLPAVCADDVIDAILLDLFADMERDGAWHGGCLALAELARRGLLLPRRLGEVVPVVIQATQYDVRRGRHTIGAHVRDAASYACWAFARAYSAEVLRPHIPALAEAIVLASLFDREVNCRRAASAAFQECVGRQGADNFKHGIDVLQVADYFSLGNRADAFTTVAIHIASFDEYRRPIIHHLSEAKLGHWDGDVRILASKSLHNLVELDPTYIADVVMPRLLKKSTDDNLAVRHGALLGCAEIVLAMGKMRDETDSTGDISMKDETANALADLVSEIEKARLYRGRGGEMMRSAVCRFIECLSLARLPLTVKQQVKLLDSLDVCLKHPNEEVQEAAAAALSSLTRSYFPVGPNGPSDRLQKRVVDKYVDIVRTEDNPAAARGYALALGRLPKKLLAPNAHVLDRVLRSLADAAKINSKVGDEGDAETRRNAILSIVGVCEEVGMATVSDNVEMSSNVVSLRKVNMTTVFDALLASMEDYNTDRRGDVGSWCRIAAMNGLVSLTLMASAAYDQVNDDVRQHFDQRLCVMVIGALLKQLSEKLDNVRLCAGSCLETLLRNEAPSLPFVPSRPTLEEALGLASIRTTERNHVNWSNPAVTFPMVMKAACIDELFEYIISGLVISVGGLTESVTKAATSAMLDWTRASKGPGGNNACTAKLSEALLALFIRHRRDGRVILPLLKTLDVLLSHGSLDTMIMGKEDGVNGISFPSKLMSELRQECKGCTDVQRLVGSVSVALGLLVSDHADVIQQDVLPFLMTMLAHRYPRVRRWAAEQLYVRLLEDGSVVSTYTEQDTSSSLDQAMQLLLEVAWDDSLDSPGNVRNSRNRVADLMGIRLSDKQREGPRQSKNREKAAVDEFESYASLVDAAGR